MSDNNTVLSQLLKLVPRHEFETLAKQHHCGRSFRTASRWSQFVIMMMAQLSGRNSLSNKPYALYEVLFGKLLSRCQGVVPGHKFQFKNPLYSCVYPYSHGLTLEPQREQ
jgi:putative transposase